MSRSDWFDGPERSRRGRRAPRRRRARAARVPPAVRGAVRGPLLPTAPRARRARRRGRHRRRHVDRRLVVRVGRLQRGLPHRAGHQGSSSSSWRACSPAVPSPPRSSWPTGPGRSTCRSPRPSRSSSSTARPSSRCAGSRVIVIPGVLGLLAGSGSMGAWKTYLLWANRSAVRGQGPAVRPRRRLLRLHPAVAGLRRQLPHRRARARVPRRRLHALRLRRPPAARPRAVHPRRVHPPRRLGALIALIRAASYWLDRYSLSTQKGALLTGITYTDANAVMPTKAILAVAAVMCAGFFLAAIWSRSWRLPFIGVGLLVVIAIVVGAIYPALIQSLKVRPVGEDLEATYIQRNIKATHAAFGIDRVERIQNPAPPHRPRPGQPCARTRRPSRACASSTPTSSRRPSASSRASGTSTPSPTPSTSTATRSTARSTTPSSRSARSTSTGSPPASATGSTTTPSTPTATASTRPTATSAPPRATRSSSRAAAGAAARRVRAAHLLRRAVAAVLRRRRRRGQPAREFDYPAGTEGTAVKNTYTGGGGVDDRLVRPPARLRRQVPRGRTSCSPTPSTPSSRHPRPPHPQGAGRARRAVAPARRQRLPGRRRAAASSGSSTASRRSANYPNSRLLDLADATSDSVTQRSNVVRSARGEVNYIRNAVKATVDAYDGSVKLYGWDANDPHAQGVEQGLPRLGASDLGDLRRPHVAHPLPAGPLQGPAPAAHRVPRDEPGRLLHGLRQVAGPARPVAADPGPARRTSSRSRCRGRRPPRSRSPRPSCRRSNNEGGREILRGLLAVDADAGIEAGKPADEYGTLRLLEYGASTPSGPGQVINQIENSTARSQNACRAAQPRAVHHQQLRSGKQLTFGNLLTFPLRGRMFYVQPLYVQASGGPGPSPRTR